MADEKTTLEDASREPAALLAQGAPDETIDLQGHKLDEMGGAQVGWIEGMASGRV